MGFGEAFTGGTLGAFSQGVAAPFVGAFAASEEADARARAFQRFKEQQRQGIHEAITSADAAGRTVANSPLAKEGKNFLFETFRSDMPPGFEHQGAQLAQQLRIAQESRGLRKSTTSAVAEATSLAAFNSQMAFQQQQFKASLLPQIEQFSSMAERYRNTRLGTDLGAQIGFYTGAPIPGISNQNAMLGDPQSGLANSIAAGSAGQAAFTSNFFNTFGAIAGGGMGGGALGGGGGMGGMGGMAKMGGSAAPQSGLFSIPKGQQGFSSGGLFAQT